MVVCQSGKDIFAREYLYISLKVRTIMKKTLTLVLILLCITGCAVTPQQPVSLNPTVLEQGDIKVGVAMTAVPEISMLYPGAGCLLCLLAAAAANSDLSGHAKTLSAEDVLEFDDLIREQLTKSGISAKLITEDLELKKYKSVRSQSENTAKRDFSPLGDEQDITHLIVINIEHLGFVRQYSSYIPKGDPQATISGAAYMVNLEDNSYTWYLPIKLYQSAQGEWKEPPTFPGLSNAYYSVVETVKDDLLDIFASSQGG